MSLHEKFKVLNLTLKSAKKAKDGRQFSQALFATVADPVPMRAWVRGYENTDDEVCMCLSCLLSILPW